MSDPTANTVLEEIASNTGGDYEGQSVRKQIDILEEIAANTKGGGSGGTGYDDTAIKKRVYDVEQKNSSQDNSIETLTKHASAQDDLITAIDKVNDDQDLSIQQNAGSIQALDKRLTADEVFHSNLIVPWGDSRSAQNWNNNTTPVAPLARSPVWWMELLSQRVRVNSDYMQGVSGDTMAQLLARIQTDTPGQFGTKKPSEVPPSIALLMCWTNSVNAGVPLATMLDQTTQVLDYLVGQGHKVVLVAEWPRGSASSTGGVLTADNQKLLVSIHNALLKIRRKNVFILDVWPRVADPSSVNAYPLANMLNPDNLHNSPGIAMIMGQEGARVLTEELCLPRIKMTCSSNTDQYDAALEPQGCLNTNPMLITTGGTVTNSAKSNASGSAPLGYTLSTNDVGLAVTGSFVTATLPDGSKRKAFRIVVSGTPTTTNAYVSIRQTGLISKVAVGDILEANYEVNVADGHSNFGSPGILIDGADNTMRAHGGLSLTGDNIAPVEAVRGFYGVPRTADLPLATLPASLGFDMRVYFTLANVACSLTMDILSASLRKKKQ